MIIIKKNLGGGRPTAVRPSVRRLSSRRCSRNKDLNASKKRLISYLYVEGLQDGGHVRDDIPLRVLRHRKLLESVQRCEVFGGDEDAKAA